MPWEEPFKFPDEDFRERSSINSPVTIVDGRGGRENCQGPTISLEQYTDYILRKFDQRKEGDWRNGKESNEWDMKFKVTNNNTDQPSKSIGFTTNDQMMIITAGLVCRVLDAGATTLTLAITYWDVIAGSTTITLTLALTALGESSTGPTKIFLLAGSTVTVSLALTGVYGLAKYDAFVGLQPVG